MEDGKSSGGEDCIDIPSMARNDSPEGPIASGEEYETFDLEYSEEDIAYYIVDEDDNELGFALRAENGEAVEYYYADTDEDAAVRDSSRDDSCSPVDDDAVREPPDASTAHSSTSPTTDSKARSSKASAKSKGEEAFLTREQAASTASDLNALFRDGKEVYDEIRGIGDDFKGMLDFLPKKRK